MAKMKFHGLEEYEKQLLKLPQITEKVIGQSVYQGAKVIADAVKASIADIPIDERRVKAGEMLNGISQAQKSGLEAGFGISTMRNDSGYINVKVGFDGYNSVRTKKYPNGQPNAMIARSVNSGTSFRQRYPFVDNAVRNTKDAAEQAMIKTFDEALKDAL